MAEFHGTFRNKDGEPLYPKVTSGDFSDIDMSMIGDLSDTDFTSTLLGPLSWEGNPLLAPDPSLMESARSTVLNVGGRAVYRHSGGKGTVMTWLDGSGTVHRTLVLDAAYRRRGVPWGGKASPEGMTAYAKQTCCIGSGTSAGDSAYDTTSEIGAASSSFTDDVINERSTYWEDAGTSASNTGNIIACWPEESYAAHFCRSNGSGIAADLPNVQTLARIYLCAEAIDSFDPTADSNGARKLSGWMGGYYVWSSTLHGPSYAWGVNYNGSVNVTNQERSYCAIPVLEL